MENIVEVGLRLLDALKAAPSKPAHHLELYDRGEIKAGKRADLVLISGNPLKNISNTRNVKRVWLGRIEYNGNLAAP
jgi:imidazolonepropionase-like amidohydrolase